MSMQLLNAQHTPASIYSKLAGPIYKISKKGSYKVTFIPLLKYDRLFYQYWTRIIAYGATLLVIIFTAVLFQPHHWVITQQPHSHMFIANLIMLLCICLLQIFAFLGAFSSTRSTIIARNPIPVAPPKGLKVAFVTTRAPGEPVAMVQNTLKAAKRVWYGKGRVDVWLLDETNDPELVAMCEKLNVYYFSRKGISKWNTAPAKKTFKSSLKSFMRIKENASGEDMHNPFLAAKTKHGNFNAWREHLALIKMSYDILAGVDTDQVAEPNYLQRLLGYFRDADVAYVVGPQVYGNYAKGMRGLVSRWAESQASFFQSTIQRAGNATTSAMFVGTNYAVRMTVLDAIGGMQPCITEDMATGLEIHSKRNPVTGNHWKSVYTPDVLAIGEGPDLWGSYFTQQCRWAAGTFDTWKKMVWRVFFKLKPGAQLHYFTMLTFYPMAAITWLLSVISSMTYLLTGATAILAPWSQFISLYFMTLIMQMSLYFWNRRFNVSPHEPFGTYGIAGIFLSTLTAPIYFSALWGVVTGKKPQFVVTAKGDTGARDSIATFHTHLSWAGVLLAGLIYGIVKGYNHPAMLVWVGGLVVICLTPVLLGMSVSFKYIIQRLKNQLRRGQFKNSGDIQNAYSEV